MHLVRLPLPKWDSIMQIKNNIAVSENGFIFNPSTGDSYSVNLVGQEIIRLMRDELSEEKIAEYLLEHYQADKPTIEKDLDEFQSMLKSYRISE